MSKKKTKQLVIFKATRLYFKLIVWIGESENGTAAQRTHVRFLTPDRKLPRKQRWRQMRNFLKPYGVKLEYQE